MIMNTATGIMSTDTLNADQSSLAQLRLLQILSPAAPVGSYSYSQGLEWVVNESWVNDVSSFQTWVQEQIDSTLTLQELPLLRRLHKAFLNNDIEAVQYWSEYSVAVRDTAELRKEERDRAEAYLRVLNAMGNEHAQYPRALFLDSPHTAVAWFCVQHGVSEQSLLTSYAHTWLETGLAAGVKIIPLGQSAGQRLLFELAPALFVAIDNSAKVGDEQIGISLPALSMASCGHELQYSRVYRS